MAKISLFNELELIAKIANGDTQAFAKIFNFYRPRVYTVSLQYLHSEQAAQDAVQEIFLKLWRMGAELNKVKNLESYLITITKHNCLNMLRRMKLESMHFETLPDEFDLIDSDTEERIILNDTKKILDQGVNLLPPQQKLVYQLCHIEGLKYKEVAEKMNLSSETVRAHLKLALRFLRQHMSNNTDVMALLLILRLL